MNKYPKVEVWFYDEKSNEDIFCFAEVTHYVNVKPNYSTWDSDWDYYGYEEIDYVLVDEKNNELNVDIDELVDEKIKAEIREYFEDELL